MYIYALYLIILAWHIYIPLVVAATFQFKLYTLKEKITIATWLRVIHNFL